MFPDSTYLAGAPGTHPPRRRGLLTSAALVAIVVAVGIVVGPATTTASAASHGCADVMFIGARGSGEPLQVKKNGKLVTVFHGVGEPVDYMAGILGADVRAYGEHMRILPVIYSADSVDDLVPSKKEGAAMVAAGAGGAAAIYYERNLKPYMASIARGASQTVAEIHATLDGCPETEIVLGGYSQGAMAIHQAELQLERAHDEDSLDAIGGTLLLGDGDRTPNTQAKIFGGAPPGGEGVRTYLHGIKAADVVEPETTAEICVTGDIVCDFNLHVGPGSTSWYKNAAHIHSSYADLPQKVYLRKATEWIAEEMGLT